MHISYGFLTRGAVCTTKWLLGEHGIILLATYCSVRLLAYHHIVDYFHLFLKRRQPLMGIFLVCKSFNDVLDYIIELIHDHLVKLLEISFVSLLVHVLKDRVQFVVKEIPEVVDHVLQLLKLIRVDGWTARCLGCLVLDTLKLLVEIEPEVINEFPDCSKTIFNFFYSCC